MSSQSHDLSGDLRTVMELVMEAMTNERDERHLSGYDDPEWAETIADHVAYRSMDVDAIEEMSVRDARGYLLELESREYIRRVTDDFWTDHKITLGPRAAEFDSLGESDQ